MMWVVICFFAISSYFCETAQCMAKYTVDSQIFGASNYSNLPITSSIFFSRLANIQGRIYRRVFELQILDWLKVRNSIVLKTLDSTIQTKETRRWDQLSERLRSDSFKLLFVLTFFSFQTKHDLQRRKEEMAQAVEATRKRLEAVSTPVLYWHGFITILIKMLSVVSCKN